MPSVRTPKWPAFLRSVARSSCTRPTRDDLPAHRLIPTRVQDTDLLGHINNVNYYAFMDSAICDWSAAHGDRVADVPRYVVETGLRYHAPAFYPEVIEVR
jgi:acyl-CoA thioester hydrolase